MRLVNAATDKGRSSGTAGLEHLTFAAPANTNPKSYFHLKLPPPRRKERKGIPNQPTSENWNSVLLSVDDGEEDFRAIDLIFGGGEDVAELVIAQVEQAHHLRVEHGHGVISAATDQ